MLTRDDTILLSGGSRGLGLDLVKAFLGAGNRVATFARSETPAVAALGTEHGNRFLFEEIDARDGAAMVDYVDRVETAFGPIGALINNAAVGQDHLLVHAPEEVIRTIVEVDIVAPTLLTRRVAKSMMLGEGGRICMISSICAAHGFPGLSVYSGAKAYLEAMTRSLARELGPAGIHVNAVAPGFFASEMSEVLRPDQIDRIRGRTPTGALVTAADLIPVLDLLLSGRSNLSGEVITVDGGHSA